MILWYLAPSIVAVHEIFRSRGLDYRLIALGALLPLLVDLPFGYYAYGHSLFVAVGVLAVVMLGTIGRPRLLRRRLICIPIGWMCGLVLSGAFLHDVSFLWPLLGSGLPGRLPGPAGDGARAARRGRARDRHLGVEPVRPRRPCDPGRLPPHRPSPGAGGVILFVRHGETEANRRRLARGRAAPPLTERGNEQAAAVAHRLASVGVRAVYASPL